MRLPGVTAVLVLIMGVPAAAATVDVSVSAADATAAWHQVEAVLCFAVEDPATPVDGSCNDARTAYTPPSPVPTDADSDGVPDAVEAAVCSGPVPAPRGIGSCQGADFSTASSKLVDLSIGAGDANTGPSVGLALDEGLNGALDPSWNASCAASSCTSANRYANHTISASGSGVDVSESTKDKSRDGPILGTHRARVCPDAAVDCAMDGDADGRFLDEEVFLCSDPTDPTSRDPAGGPLGCFFIVRANALVAFVTFVSSDEPARLLP